MHEEGLPVPLLQVEDLRVHFRTKDGLVRAVNGVSYELEEGDILGIVGESGCGKSVSALALLRLIPEPPGEIAGGHAYFEGQDLLALKRKELYGIRGRKIAMIFQDPMTSLNPVMPIGEQVAEAIWVNSSVSRREARRRAIEVLAQVGVPAPAERYKDYPHQFSGGMRQRVMIAMAISCQPRLLIADEPTTALDVTIQAQIVELVKRLQRELGMAVIWITHDLGLVARVARRICVMYAGRIVEIGPIKEVFSRPQHPYTLGLLASVPRGRTGRRQPLRHIEGAPPDMISLPPGCAFQPRCQFCAEECLQEEPSLVALGDGHLAACHRLGRLPVEALAPKVAS
jgi:oligopeptide transport system ATP-binding protein